MDAAESGQDQAIRRLKAGPVNLAFEDTQLVTKSENKFNDSRRAQTGSTWTAR